MTQHGKRYTGLTGRYDREAQYNVADAIELVKSMASAKFDETVELAVRLGVDPRKADQIVRGTRRCRRAPASQFGWLPSPPARKPPPPGPPAPTWSGPTTWWPGS